MPGVEEIAWLEIRDRLQKVNFGEYLFAKDQNGIVTFEYAGSPEPLLQLRTTEDVFIQAVNIRKMPRTRGTLQEITDIVHKSETFGRAVRVLLRHRKYSKPPTYRVISRQYGSHPFERKSLELAVLRGLDRRYRNWTLVPDHSQIEVWANQLGSQLLIGLRISDRTMRHRFKKKRELPASLRPSVAAAMVFLTQPEAGDSFLDPMCGSGTLLLERRFAGPYKQILGGDHEDKAISASQRNVMPRKQSAKRDIRLRKWDARRLPLTDGSVDKVAVNLPFGKQISSPRELKTLYPAVLKELERVVRVNGRIVLLSSAYDQVKDAVRQCPNLEIMTGYSIAVLGKWGRIYILKRIA